MNRGAKWGLGLGIPAGILAATAVGLLIWINSPVETASYEDPESVQATERNGDIYAALVAGGIDDPFVDAAPSQTYIAYEPPAGSERSANDWQWFVLGAAAEHMTGSDKLVAVLYDGDDPALSWTVDADDLSAYLEGDLDREAFEARIDTTTF